MPAFTVNRNYPYAIPADVTDIPQAFEDLATAIDADVCALQNGLTGRPVARFRGVGPFDSISPTHPVNAPPTPYTDRIPFNVTDFNTANVTMTSAEIGQRLIFPEDPGFYFAMVTLAVPPLTVAGASTLFLGLQIRRGDFTNPMSLVTAPLLAACANSASVTADDRNLRLMSLGCGVFMNGTTDAFSVEFRADTNPDVAAYTISDRTITILKMT